MRWFIKALKIKVPENLQEEATYIGKNVYKEECTRYWKGSHDKDLLSF